MTAWLTWEFALLDSIAQLHNPLLDTLMAFISTLGNSGMIWIMISIILICTKRYRRGGWLLALALVFCLVVGNLTLKPLVARIRPFDINTVIPLLIAPPTDFSFPSGHSMSSFAAATVLFHIDRHIGWPALILATFIAFSRLYLYVHYPTDVLFGIIIGVALGGLAIWIFRRFLPQKQ